MRIETVELRLSSTTQYPMALITKGVNLCQIRQVLTKKTELTLPGTGRISNHIIKRLSIGRNAFVHIEIGLIR